MKLASYLATLNCLEFTFLKGPNRNWQGGTSFGCQNWSRWTDFGGGSFFALQAKGSYPRKYFNM